jgi:hypothetical protein
MAKVGRRWRPSAKDRATVKAMVGYGIPQLEICAVLGITKPTLEKRCRVELDTRMAEANVNAAVVGLLGAALYNPVWTSSVKTPGDFGIALVGFVLLTVWRAPPLVVVTVSALGGMALALATIG